MKYTITCLLLLLCSIVVKAQLLNYNFTNYTVANGLADNSVQSILQDSRGFMWFGTREGLSRFDGNNFKNYFSSGDDTASMAGNYISCLFEYRPSQLLFLSNGQVNTLDTRHAIFAKPFFFRSKTILNIAAKRDAGYFFCTRDSNFVTDKNLQVTDTLIPPLNIRNDYVLARVLDSSTWLVNTMHEFFLYDPVSKKYRRLDLEVKLPDDKKLFGFHYYNAATKELYISNFWYGLYCFSMEGKLMRHWAAGKAPFGLNSNDIRFVVPKSDSIYWAGTIGGGLNVINIRSNRITAVTNDPDNINALVGNDLMCSYRDRDDNEWLGTLTGVSKISNRAAAITAYRGAGMGYSKDASIVGIVKGSNGHLFIGAYFLKTICELNPNTQKVTVLKYPNMVPVWTVNNFDTRLVFSGAGKSVTWYDPVKRQYEQSSLLAKYFPASDIVTLTFKDSHGDVWFSGNNGGGFVRRSAADDSIHVYKKDGPHGNFTISYYASYAEDKDGNLWFGVNKSSLLLHWNRAADRFSEIDMDTVNGTVNKLKSGISELTTGSNGSLWIAYDGAGLLNYDIAHNKATHYSIFNGLPTNYVNALDFDRNGRLWVGTLKGLCCLLPEQHKFINFTVKNGLPDDYFSERSTYYDSATNRMWISSRSIVISFNPDELLRSNTRKLPVYIDELFVNGEKYRGDIDSSVMYFGPAENNLQFRFIAVDVSNGNDVEYSYKLSDLNKEWVLNGNVREVNFSELPPGNYSLAVRVKHKGDNEWVQMQQPVRFTVQAPWFKTLWFRLLLLLFISVLFFILIKTYLARQLHKQKIAMEKELAVEQERIRMARELHDGLGSMLSGIKHSFSAIKNDIALNNEQENKFDYTIGKLDDSIKDLRAVSHSMFSAELLEDGLDAAIRNYCTAVSTTAGIKISFENIMQQPPGLKGEQAFHIFRVVQELVQNVLKHSHAANAIVQLSYDNGTLALTVEDNGIGFTAASPYWKNGIGLKNVESRIKMLHGKMDIQSQPGKGTSVFIEVPVK